METVKVDLEAGEAQRLYREYLKARAPLTAIDREVKATYREIARGNVVIQALESIVAAGLNDEGLPKLCIARATAQRCWLAMRKDWTQFRDAEWLRQRQTNSRIEIPTERFAAVWKSGEWFRSAWSAMPTIPPRLRPAADQLENFHVLWEAEWRPVPPRDPLLLRRIGKGDLWVVCAAWDLTEVERGAMATRVMGAT